MSFTMIYEWDENKLPAYAARLDAAVQKTRRDVALEIANEARQLVKVDTGSLRGTIDAEELDAKTSTVNSGNLTGGYTGKEHGKPAGAPVDYAEEQEYGSKGQPHMTPASESGWVRFQQEEARTIAGVK